MVDYIMNLYLLFVKIKKREDDAQFILQKGSFFNTFVSVLLVIHGYFNY